MELKYTLKQPLVGVERNYTETAKKSLLLETNGTCAKCGKMYNALKINSIDDIALDFDRSNLEIAHIYGLKNFINISHIGKKFHIKNIDDLNKYENLLLLCHECHTNYDKKPNYENYVEMVNIKSNLSKKWKLNDYVYYNLLFNLDDIKKTCSSIKHIKKFSYDSAKFLKKMNINDIDDINIEHYSNYLQKYAVAIDDFFSIYDEEIGLKLITAFSKLYEDLKTKIQDKNIILSTFANDNVFKELSKTMNPKIFDALLAYMIWKCEVLDKNDTAR